MSMKPILLLSILIAFLGCSKKTPISTELNFLIGDYDFIYSTFHNDTSIVNSDLESQYGIRITSKYKLLIFKDGVQIEKYKLVGEEKFEPSFGMSYVQIKYARNSWYPFYFSGDTIMMRLSPSMNKDNYYLKQ